MVLIKTLYQFVKDSIVAQSASVIKNSNIFQNNWVICKLFIYTASTIDFYILTKPITSYNKKSLEKSLYTQQKKLSSLKRDCNLFRFTTNETITNLAQYELSQEESDLLKAGLYFSIQLDKIRKSEIFTTVEKIHRSFLNNLKSEETKRHKKAHLSYLANSFL